MIAVYSTILSSEENERENSVSSIGTCFLVGTRLEKSYVFFSTHMIRKKDHNGEYIINFNRLTFVQILWTLFYVYRHNIILSDILRESFLYILPQYDTGYQSKC